MFQKGGLTKKGWRKNRGGIIARSTLVEHRHIFGWGGRGVVVQVMVGLVKV